MPMPDLGKQIGPLPLGAWIIVVGGGLGVSYYVRKNQQAKGPGIVNDTSGMAGVGTGPGWMAVPPPTTGPETPQITTNEDWGKAAINYLIAQGYDPAVADQAVRKYLQSEKLTLQELAMIRYALVKLGSPPIPLPPAPDLPAPPVTPPPPPPPPPPAPPKPPTNYQDPTSLRWYTVKKGDSLWRIAVKFYGRGLSWHDLFNANRNGYTRPDGSRGVINNPNLIYPGQKLWVPGW